MLTSVSYSYFERDLRMLSDSGAGGLVTVHRTQFPRDETLILTRRIILTILLLLIIIIIIVIIIFNNNYNKNDNKQEANNGRRKGGLVTVRSWGQADDRD